MWIRTCASILLAALLVLPPAVFPADDTAKRLYDRVMSEFQNKDYEAALAGFRLFVELHGQSSLAPSAQYWIGECEYRLGRYGEAVTSFDKVLTSYPSSVKIASATLKKALSFQKLGLANQSRILLERVLVQFPTSQEADLAKKALNGQ